MLAKDNNSKSARIHPENQLLKSVPSCVMLLLRLSVHQTRAHSKCCCCVCVKRSSSIQHKMHDDVVRPFAMQAIVQQVVVGEGLRSIMFVCRRRSSSTNCHPQPARTGIRPERAMGRLNINISIQTLKRHYYVFGTFSIPWLKINLKFSITKFKQEGELSSSTWHIRVEWFCYLQKKNMCTHNNS